MDRKKMLSIMHVPAQVLLELDVGSEKLAQVDFSWILTLLHIAKAVLQLSDFRSVIRPPCPHLVNIAHLRESGR